MLKRKMAKMTILLSLILVFIISMTAMLFCQTYPSSDSASYDYLALGDSYSAGQTPYEVTAGYSYADRIRDKLDAAGLLKSYYKKGVSGYETTDVMRQLRSMKKLLYRADIVTLDVGLNDILHLSEVDAYLSKPSADGFEAAQAAAAGKIPEIEANIRKVIGTIKDANPFLDPKIYIMGYFNAYPDVPQFLPVIKQLNNAISAAAEETGVTYIDTMATIDEKINEYLPGDIHPTVEGYNAIAEEFWKSISEDFLISADVFKFTDEAAGYPDGSLHPGQAVTHAEFITIINRFFNLTDMAEVDFKDIPENAWYRTELRKAVKAGYIAGGNLSSFRADDAVTRQEAAVMIARILRFDISKAGNEAAQFKDGQDIPSWSRASINALIRYGILKGYPDSSIRYGEKLTRAEALSLLDHIAAFIDSKAP